MGRTPKQVIAGTHRALAEEETLSRLQPLLSRFGITRVANITGLDDIGIPTVVVTRPDSRSLSVSQGKGLSLAAAKVSGIMESIEQYHAERMALPLRLASYEERRQDARVVDVTLLPRYVRPFDPHERTLWVEGVSMRTGDTVEIPAELVHLDLRLPLPPGSGFWPIGSNGLASGNCLAEAISHGVWELIERDAIALFYQRSPSEQSLRRLKLDTVSGSAALLLDRFEAAGVGVALWDITTDLHVPAYFCSIVEKELDPFRPVGMARGYGCHIDSEVAICRALTEAAQSRLTRISGSRDDLQKADFGALRSAENIALHQQQLSEPQLREFAATPSLGFDTFEEDLRWALDRLSAIGLDDILYVDLSRPELPLTVVRIVIPGLEGAADVPGYTAGKRALDIMRGVS
jgi:YcaO-like protein with predicted kinase domain